MTYRLILTVIFLQSIQLFAQSSNEQGASYAAIADQLLRSAVQQEACTGIAAGFSIAGDIKWTGAAGFRDAKAQKPFEPTTSTRIASITKSMTAIAILQLYEQGKIDLGQKIQTYLPDFPNKQEGDITIGQLLHHSSGIAAYQSNKERENTTHYADLEDAVDLFKDRDLLAVPGTAFHYTTYGYVVLGLIIERVSGLTYEQYLKTNIWDPAGMSHTGIESAAGIPTNRASIYHKGSNGKIKAARRTDLSDRIPGGGVYSTVPDMLKFGDAVLDHTLIRESTLRLMLEDSGLKKEGNAYGFGWYLYGENPKYGPVFGHNGAQTGASTFLMLLPEQKTSIIVLSNTSGAMQEVSNITIQLFDVAAANPDFEK